MQELMGEGGSGQLFNISLQPTVALPLQHEKQQEAEERRQTMLASVLQPAARERLARIALVKPDKARGIENMVLQMAQRGQLTEKLSEERLVGVLEQISEKNSTRTKVIIQRRRPAFDDDF
eukprot:jgi/Astpho2/7662/e_gw1.00115.146.1_t